MRERCQLALERLNSLFTNLVTQPNTWSNTLDTADETRWLGQNYSDEYSVETVDPMTKGMEV